MADETTASPRTPEPDQNAGTALADLERDLAHPPNPRGLRILRYLGPGLLVSMAGIGTSHLVTAPLAGAHFEFVLLWVVPVAYLVKWQGFELAVRYTAATGESVLDAYARIPGPRNWALWVVALSAVGIGVTAVGAIVSAAAAVLWASFGAGPLLLYGVLLAALAVGLLLSGRYRGLELVNKALAIVLVVGTLIAFVARGPEAGAWTHLLVPALPAGSALIVAGLLGWLPTDLTVSVWASEWMRDKARGMVLARNVHGPGIVTDTPERYRAYVDGWYRAALYDFRIGHVASWILATMYLALGAVILFPLEEKPAGAATVLTISNVFTDTVGSWMFPVFIAGAFAALFSTALIVFDGFPRAFAASAVRIAPPRPGRSGRRWWSQRNAGLLLVGVLLVSTVTVIGVLPDPALLIPAAGTVSFVVSPLLFGLNLYVASTQITEPRYRLGRFVRIWSWASLILLTVLTIWIVPQTLNLL